MTKLLLDEIFSGSPVLPLGKPFRISGQTTANSQVTGSGANQIVQTNSDNLGNFCLRFNPVFTKKIDFKIESSDVFCKVTIQFGQVFLFSGQSNIEFRLRDSQTYQETLNDFPELTAYYFETPQIEYVDEMGNKTPSNMLPGQWQKITPENCGLMSAVAFYAIAEIQKQNPGLIIGVVDCYKGGTSASSWVPNDVLMKHPRLVERFIKPYKKAIAGKDKADFDEENLVYRASVNQHNKKLEEFLSRNPKVSLSEAKKAVGHTPWPPPMQPTSFLRPGGLFDTMVTQIIPYTFNQMVWYQGENDADNPDVYTELLRTLITTWRSRLYDDSLPVSLIQLPAYEDEPDFAWAKIRQAELKVALNLPYVNLISIIDTGDRHNIHPIDKKQIGLRIGKLLNGPKKTTPIPKIQEWSTERLVIRVPGVTNLIVKGVPEFEILLNGHLDKVIAKVVDNYIIINGDFDEVSYQYQNYTQPTIFDENCLPLAAVKLKKSADQYGLGITD